MVMGESRIAEAPGVGSSGNKSSEERKREQDEAWGSGSLTAGSRGSGTTAEVPGIIDPPVAKRFREEGKKRREGLYGSSDADNK